MPKPSKINFFDIILSHGDWLLKFRKMSDFLFGTAAAFMLSKRKSQGIPSRTVRSILVIRPGGIGDAVFLLPILKILRTAGISIHVLCETRNKEVFSSQGYPVFLWDRLGSLRQLIRNSYDMTIDTEQWHYLSALISYVLKSNCRIGFSTRPLRSKLFDKQADYKENDYELDNFIRLFEYVLPFQDSIKDINGSFHVPEALKTWAHHQIPQESVTIFLGASIALRRFTKEQLLNLISDVLSKGHCPVLLGGNDAAAVAGMIVENINHPKLFNFTGRVSLVQSAALIQRSRQLIAPDSGLMHLGCAVGTPVLAVFGPGHLQKWSPKGSRHQIITAGVSCSPCTRFGYTVSTCRGSYHCMKEAFERIRIQL